MLLVVDASVIVQVSLAGGVLGPLQGHDMIAPDLLRSEVTSSLCEMAYRGDVPPEHSRVAVTRLGGLPIRYVRPDDLDERAWDLARSLGWAKSYDAEYVALALVYDVPLVTIDDRLRRGAGHVVSMPTPTELPIGRRR
ncbi:MAG: type II toxin-antitoxin system VapC family toxin [Candidatus Limnocylindrales bacterium]|nr:type II toxin-antitoxin system VapC family toxin [Candidatus Limnocylindrales bacterium]